MLQVFMSGDLTGLCLYITTYLKLNLTLREPLVNRKDLQALTLVGPPKDNLEPDPLTVLHLDNRLYIYLL